ncbi:efflux RND transporter periplasmic adaptor subunit [Marinobacterium sedimentorum]|uniref:efflux RND transporter periplasmic adaptor subunit n=1 Tax=Marinobacterium sedimentorum TaxID=2927804 RepID=UPI0020C7445D|nr:efflux RND transporter periplasmic adaptor subunit [Marinobacterium sedimentorum]MCP8688181.1 efflux RND transporter periplasmic adaptor subunit [Marinobacterium sedimentorum]
MKTRDLILPLLLALPSSAWASEEGQQQPRGLPAEVVLLKPQPLTPVIQAVGNLQANESVIIRPEQSGQIRKILFLEGQAVKAGELMFQLDTALYDAALTQSKARVSLSQQEYSRAQSLLQRKVGSQNDRDAAMAQLRVDEAEVTLARTRIEKMNIRAPFAGITGLRQVSPGDYVSTGQDLVELIDNSSLKVDFRIPEIYLATVAPGQPVTVEVDAFPGQRFAGEIYALAPSSDARAHNLELRARIPNTDGTLRPGLFARVELQGETQAQALLVPEQAILLQEGAFSLMRVNSQGMVEIVPVTLGQRRPGKVQILSGASAGDTIVTAGHLKLFPGMPVTPVFVDGSSDAARPQEPVQ